MQINLSSRQLRAFIALVGEKNFTRAAAASHLSQPAFSALIRQLEESIGIRLFERTTRMVELTSEGAEFEPAARRVLDDVDMALAGVDDRGALRSGRVSIALLPSLAADWLPAVLAGFRAKYPGIEMHVADVLSEPCIDAVRGRRADFALAATRADTSELRAERFCSDGFHLVCPAGHPLLSLSQVRPKDVAAWPFIHLSRTSSVRQYIDAATNPRTFASVLEVDQLATVSGMVRAGLGISIVPALTLYQFKSPQLATRPIRWKGLTRHIYLVQKRERALSIASQSLKDWLLAHRPKIAASA
jgi:LysR family transcriptional regulator, carnitine catabolism transcriptional activator